jgi:hypothetical protein
MLRVYQTGGVGGREPEWYQEEEEVTPAPEPTTSAIACGVACDVACDLRPGRMDQWGAQMSIAARIIERAV